MAKQKVSQVIVSLLAKAGVKRIYGLIGDSLNPIGDAVRVDPNIEWIGIRHEESGALAASAEAFLTNKLCVCAGTAGPGSVHLINGLYEANRNHVPVLAIVTDFISSEIGLGYFQATTPMRLYQDCSIFCERLSDTSQMPRLLQEAMQSALSYKGVAVLIVPKDISEKEIESDNPYIRPIIQESSAISPNYDDIQKMADYINQFKNITLYCGMGCHDAAEEVIDIADTLQAPTVCTLRSKDFMAVNNPFNVGMNGLLSRFESKYALENCDLLIMLGVDFHGVKFIPTKPHVIQVDIAGKHLGRRNRMDMGIIGDIKLVLQALKPLLKPNDNPEHLKKSIEYFEEDEKKKKSDLEKMKSVPKLRPELLTDTVSRFADYNAVFLVDVGLNDIWAARYLNPEPNRIIMGSFKHGTMAAALPEGFGAHYAEPDRQIIILAGDGGLTMLLGELLTVVQYKIPLKIIVYNNGELGFINHEAEMEKIPPFATTLKNPDFAAMAEVMGIHGIRIDSPDNLDSIIKQALAEKGPFLIDAVTDSLAIGN